MENALAKINAQIEALKRRAESIRINRRASELQKILRRMHEHLISPKDIQLAYAIDAAGRTRRKEVQRRPESRNVVAPKYCNPESGETWTGRGRAPRWLAAAERAGRPRDEFRI